MTDWRNNAACRSASDPDLFFPVQRSGQAFDHQVAQAKAVCAPCPVRTECRSFADTIGTDYGIWSGETEDERRARRGSPAPTG